VHQLREGCSETPASSHRVLRQGESGTRGGWHSSAPVPSCEIIASGEPRPGPNAQSSVPLFSPKEGWSSPGLTGGSCQDAPSDTRIQGYSRPFIWFAQNRGLGHLPHCCVSSARHTTPINICSLNKTKGKCQRVCHVLQVSPPRNPTESLLRRTPLHQAGWSPRPPAPCEQPWGFATGDSRIQLHSQQGSEVAMRVLLIEGEYDSQCRPWRE
jgi:hypothetical protein